MIGEQKLELTKLNNLKKAKSKMNVAILGFGTVGSNVYNLLEKSNDINVIKILDRKPLEKINNLLTYDINDIVNDENVDLVVETIGGLQPAYDFAKKVIESGKHFVTANKMLIGTYGVELLELAYKNNVGFLYSSCCGGGIPILQNIKNMQSIDNIEEIGGILNGTTNFILDNMHCEKMSYQDALKQAQTLGYAEAEPSFDVEGKDVGYKIILCCFVAYNKFIKIEDMNIYGISTITKLDIEYAEKNGFVIRLCGKIEHKNNKISAFVEPVMTTNNSTESSILKNLNYAYYKCSNCGLFGFIGQGAGGFPTASNVVRDILSIRDNNYYFNENKVDVVKVDNQDIENSYYIRIKKDENISTLKDFIKEQEDDNEYSYIKTKPIKMTLINQILKNNKNCFYAKIESEKM